MNVSLDSQLGLTTEQLFVRVYTYTECHQLLARDTSGGECQAIAALGVTNNGQTNGRDSSAAT